MAQIKAAIMGNTISTMRVTDEKVDVDILTAADSTSGQQGIVPGYNVWVVLAGLQRRTRGRRVEERVNGRRRLFACAGR